MTEAEMDNQVLINNETDDFYTRYSTPIITLSNGLRVANFSSNHEFKFVDGTVLPAVSDELCSLLSGHMSETVVNQYDRNRKFDTISIEFYGNDRLRDAIKYWRIKSNTHPNYLSKKEVDVVIVPLPIMQWIKKEYVNLSDYSIEDLPFRVIRVADRLTKTIYIDKFCI